MTRLERYLRRATRGLPEDEREVLEAELWLDLIERAHALELSERLSSEIALERALDEREAREPSARFAWRMWSGYALTSRRNRRLAATALSVGLAVVVVLPVFTVLGCVIGALAAQAIQDPSAFNTLTWPDVATPAPKLSGPPAPLPLWVTLVEQIGPLSWPLAALLLVLSMPVWEFGPVLGGLFGALFGAMLARELHCMLVWGFTLSLAERRKLWRGLLGLAHDLVTSLRRPR